MCILDTGVQKPMFCKAFAIVVGINVHTLTPRRPSLTIGGEMEESMGVTEEVTFILNRGKPEEQRCSLEAMVMDTKAYCVLPGIGYIAGGIDRYMGSEVYVQV